MEKQVKPKNKILKFLPRAASAIAVSFQNPPFSPGRDKRSSEINMAKLKAHAGRGFSGPIISMIPDEARRKPRNIGGMYETQEPTSPKVSCMGQIKHKKKIMKAKRAAAPPARDQVKAVPRSTPSHHRDKKKHASAIRRMFSGKTKPAGKNFDVVSPATEERAAIPGDRMPSLGQMKRFASGRNSLSDFDWMAQITPTDRGDHRNYYSDEERDEESDQEEEKVRIPFSAPMMLGGGGALQPRKEVNLWKRRTMAPPRPLDLKYST